MFFVERERLIAGLESLATSVCAYTKPPCDCKYGFTGKRTSEQTGCPEASAAAMVLRNMTDAQYRRLTRPKREPIAWVVRFGEKPTGGQYVGAVGTGCVVIWEDRLVVARRWRRRDDAVLVAKTIAGGARVVALVRRGAP